MSNIHDPFSDLPPPEKTFPLWKPVTANGKDIESVTLRAPTLVEMIAAEEEGMKGNYAMQRSLIKSTSGLDMLAVNQLSVPDTNAMAAYLVPFLGPRLMDGSRSTPN